MKRAVIILAYESMYQGLHGMNDLDVQEFELEELHSAQENGHSMAWEVYYTWNTENEDEEIDESDCCDYILYRQKDTSDLTVDFITNLVNVQYGFEVDKWEYFKEHFYYWS